MGRNSLIPWTNHTFNHAWGCTKYSDGCERCYAQAQMERFGFDQFFGVAQPRRLFGDKHWNEPLKWNRDAQRKGVPAKVFCASMADWCENHPDMRGQLLRLWELIRKTPWLDWQLCTKRAGDIEECLPPDWGVGWHNVWLGVTVESAKYAERARVLSKIPAVVRWISNEPALGDISDIDLSGIDWIVYGGETGSGFRPDDKDWAPQLAVACDTRGTAFFYKQKAAPLPGVLPSYMIKGSAARREFPKPRPGRYAEERRAIYVD